MAFHVAVGFAALVLSAFTPQRPVTALCEACGETITDRYVQVGDDYYHPDHFLCAHCRKPIASQYRQWDGGYYHELCYGSVALKCQVCARSIDGSYLFDSWGNRYHPEHRDEYPTCSFCDRLVAGVHALGAVRHPDGRNLCGNCAATIITTDAAVRAYVVAIAEAFTEIGFQISADDVTTLMVSAQELQKVAPYANHPEGHADCGTRTESCLSANILLLYGMPETQLTKVLSHEMMHAWQFMRRYRIDKALLEGTANYLAYRVLGERDNAEARFVQEQMLADPDPIYGEAFRKVKDYVESHSLADLRAILEAGDTLPE